MSSRGWTIDEAADRLHLYDAAADSVIGLATAKSSEVLARVPAVRAPGR